MSTNNNIFIIILCLYKNNSQMRFFCLFKELYICLYWFIFLFLQNNIGPNIYYFIIEGIRVIGKPLTEQISIRFYLNKLY